MASDELTYTVQEMYRLSRTYVRDVAPLLIQDVYQAFDYVKGLPYVTDQASCNRLECLKRPEFTMQSGGDCDDKAILAGAIMEFLKVPWRLVTTSYATDKVPSHVYLEIYKPLFGGWRPFDATYPSGVIFTERPYTFKEVWPMKETVKLGVSSLEGLGDTPTIPNQDQWTLLLKSAGQQVLGPGFDPKTATQASIVGKLSALASAAVPIPVVGAVIGTVVGVVLSAIGIKKATDHMTPADANSQATNIANSVVAVYRKLPPDGKTYMAGLCKNFIDRMLADFGTWWGTTDLGHGGTDPSTGFLNRVWGEAKSKYITNEDSFVWWSILAPCYVVLRAADLSTVSANFQKWVLTDRLGPIVLTPLQKYVEDKLGAVLTINAGGTLTISEPENKVAAVTSSPLFWGVVAAAGYILTTMFKKKGK